MLTQKDLDELEQLIKDIVREEIKHLPSKNDFYNKMDELMGELKAIREGLIFFTRDFFSLRR